MASVTTPRSQMRGSNGVRNWNQYPNQFFDLSSAYMPTSIKEMFRWCQFLYMTHSEIAPIINKKCSYVITELIYDTKSSKDQEAWQELLERTLRIREFEYKLLIDREVYGNAFCSLSLPFERFLVCQQCKTKTQLRSVKTWSYRDNAFRGKCPSPQCQELTSEVQFDIVDTVVKNRKRIKLIRWCPLHIDIQYNPFTGQSVYIYKIPQWVKTQIAQYQNDANKLLVAETPRVILEAIKSKKNIALDSDNVYHLKNESVSMENDAFGLPPMLAIFKDAWLFQTYRRAQEAIAVDHILPMTLLIPAPAGDGTSPHMSANLGDWASSMQTLVQRWRRDQNSIFTAPFPATVENIRGDAQALNVHNDMIQIRQQIAGGLDVPQEFIYGGLNWSGSSISLRVLENLFISRIGDLNCLLRDFIVTRLQRFCELPPIKIHHRDFKMADDAQQKQIALGLRATNTISDRTTVEELGFDWETEQIRRKAEEEERSESTSRMMLQQAEVQGQALVVQSGYQAKAEIEQQKAREQALRAATGDGFTFANAEAAQTLGTPTQQVDNVTQQSAMAAGASAKPAAGGSKPASAGGAKKDAAKKGKKGDGIKFDQKTLDAMAHHMIKSTDPSMLQSQLSVLSETNPQLAKAVQQRIKLVKGQVKELKPLPEQKPPRRANSPV
jgi:hypothetical protein